MENLDITWAIVAATFIGPVVAVLITLWYQRSVSRKDAQRAVYATMMRNRRYVISQDFVGAFNLVPVHFHRNPKVLEKYRAVLAITNDTNWTNSEARPRLHQQADTAITDLLSKMSKAVGLPIEQLDILNGSYAPQGWADDEQEQRYMRKLVTEVLAGQRRLPVAP